jgi:hypothetical protein
MQPYESSKASSGKELMSSASCTEGRSVIYILRKSFVCVLTNVMTTMWTLYAVTWISLLQGWAVTFTRTHGIISKRMRADFSLENSVLNTMKHKILLHDRFSSCVTAIRRLGLHCCLGKQSSCFYENYTKHISTSRDKIRVSWMLKQLVPMVITVI